MKYSPSKYVHYFLKTAFSIHYYPPEITSS